MSIKISVVILICITQTHTSFGQAETGLTSASVSEGACDPRIREQEADNIDTLWLSMPVNYYVPIASEGCFRSYAEALLGRPARSQEELNSMKLRIRVKAPATAIFYSYGFNENRYFRQSCPPPKENTSGTQVLCRPLSGLSGPGTDLSGIKTSLDTVIYTDNNSTLVIVRCLNDMTKDYKVLTTGPTVDPQTQQIIVEKIQKAGFNANLLRIKSY